MRLMILLAYCVSTSLMPTLERSFAVQREFPLASDCTSTLISNKGFPPIGDGPDFNLARARNYAIGFARIVNADWIVCLDSDSVWLGVSRLPESGYGLPLIRFQRKGESLDCQSAQRIQRGQNWQHGSWFILRRDIFTQPWCRFDERFVGHGYEDWDFNRNILAAHGVHRSDTDAHALHLYHSIRSRPLAANRDLFVMKKRGRI